MPDDIKVPDSNSTAKAACHTEGHDDKVLKAAVVDMTEAVVEQVPEAPYFPRPRGAAPHGPGGVKKQWDHATGDWDSQPATVPELTAKRPPAAKEQRSKEAQVEIVMAAESEMIATEGEMMATEVTEVKDDVTWKKSPWTPREDQMLRDLMADNGDKVHWTSFGEKMSGRTGKQCRERWHNHLSPDVSKDKWTEEEDARLFKEVSQKGTHWAEIVKCFPGRTDNTIKNRYNSAIRKRERHARKAERIAQVSPKPKKIVKRAEAYYVAVAAPAPATMDFGVPTSVDDMVGAAGAAATTTTAAATTTAATTAAAAAAAATTAAAAAAAAVAQAEAYLQQFDKPSPLAHGIVASTTSSAMGAVVFSGTVLPPGAAPTGEASPPLASVTPLAAPATTPPTSSVFPVATAFEISESPVSQMVEDEVPSASPWVVFSAGAETFSVATAEVAMENVPTQVTQMAETFVSGTGGSAFMAVR